MLELYHAAGSVCAQKVRIGLFETGLAWQSRLLDLAKGEQLRPEYLALNPDGVVPTLLHDGLVVRESSLIIEYLDGLSSGPRLMPSDPAQVVATRLWLIRTLEIHTAISTMSFATIFREMERASRTPDEIEAWLATVPNPATGARRRELMAIGVESVHVDGALHVLLGMLRELQTALERGPWLGGQHFGLADVALVAYVDRLARIGMAGLWSARLPRVGEWLADCRARPSYASAIAAYVPAAMAEMSLRAGEAAWPAIARRIRA